MVKNIADQALDRGVPIPYGAYAIELRNNGWTVTPDIPDTALLVPDVGTVPSLGGEMSPLCSWRVAVTQKVERLAFIAETILSDPEYKGMEETLNQARDLSVEKLTLAADKADRLGYTSFARYYRAVADFTRTLSWKKATNE